MTKTIYLNLKFLFLLNSFLWGVEQVGAPFLLISPSATINGLAGAGTSVSTTDIYSSYYNPAQPQLPNGLSFQISDTKTNWLPNLVSDQIYNYDVKMIGYNGFSLFNKYHLQTSITKSTTYLALSRNIVKDLQIEVNQNPYVSSDAITYSLGIKYNHFPVYLGIGMTHKKVTQAFFYSTSKNKLYDWGFKFSIDNYKPTKFQNIGLFYSFGYSKSNIGDSIEFNTNTGLPIGFVIPNTGSPPITARLGMTLGGHVNIYNNLGIDFKFIREAQELMLEYDSSKEEFVAKDGYWSYIDIKKHIFNGIGDENVIVHKGSEITLLNFYSIRMGRYIDIDGRFEYETNGMGIDFGEMIKCVSYIFKIPSIREIKLLNYINLKYNSSKYNAETNHPLDNISFDDFTISIKNIYNIFKDLKKQN